MDVFQDVDSKKVVNILDILDDLYISFRTQELSHIIDEVKLLREDIFQLVEEKLIHDQVKSDN